jgi:hypothetical protein
MIVIDTTNAHSALPIALQLLYSKGIKEVTRNGPVLRMPTPVTTVYQNPLERLVFHPWRDQNPFFLCVEALWIIAGRDDLKPLTRFVKRMADYSDDGGKTQPAAYGKRLRGHFWADANDLESEKRLDQLEWVVRRLQANPGDRRVVLQMWDPEVDAAAADRGGKDVPCNLTLLPWVESGHLHLTVFNRSNDAIWGAYNANAVQFGTILEYLSLRVGIPVGTLTTVANNLHMYEVTAPPDGPNSEFTDYPLLSITPAVLGYVGLSGNTVPRICQEDLAMFFEYKTHETQLKARSTYLRSVACPLVMAHEHYKAHTGMDRYTGAQEILRQMPGCEWRLSAQIWLQKRQKKEGLNLI